MYCKECGNELEDDAEFCSNCGNAINEVKQKNMFLALFLSFIFSGLGIIYAGNLKKGLAFVASRFLLPFLGFIHPALVFITIVVWVWSIYETYREVRFLDGISNPNLVKDIKKLKNNIENWTTQKKMFAIFVFIVIMIAFAYLFINAMYPDHPSTSSSYHSHYTSGGSRSHYGGVDTSPSTIARNDPDWYYDYYEYGDFMDIDDYLESQGY